MTTEMKGRPTMSSLREEQIKLLEMTHVTKTYQVGGQTVRALDSIDLTLTWRRIRVHRRPVGRGQEHLAPHARCSGPAGLWVNPVPRP